MLLQVRLEFTTPAYLCCTVYKYRALTNCALEPIGKIVPARCGVRTHAIFRLQELKSCPLDHSANLALLGDQLFDMVSR